MGEPTFAEPAFVDPLVRSTVARASAPTTDIWTGYSMEAAVQAVLP